jgi:hypothetical protein
MRLRYPSVKVVKESRIVEKRVVASVEGVVIAPDCRPAGIEACMARASKIDSMTSTQSKPVKLPFTGVGRSRRAAGQRSAGAA